MKFSMEFEIDNSAFAEDPAVEICAILDRVKLKIQDGSTFCLVYDTNGNMVGQYYYDEE